VTVPADFGNTHRAIVKAVTANGVTVEIPLLAPGADWGPIPTCVPNLAVGENVLVTQISTSRDTLAVIGRVPGRAPTISEIATLSATIAALQAADAAIQAAATTLTGRVTTAEGTIASQGARLTTAEGTIASQGTRLTTAEGTIASQGTRLTTAEGNITSLTSTVGGHTTTLSGYGTRLTALEDTTAVGKIRSVWQASDQNQNNSNGGTTYTNSTYLTLPVLAGGVYWWESQIFYDCRPPGQIKLFYLAPAGSSLRMAPWFSGDAAGNAAIWHDVFDGWEFFPGGKTSGGMMSCRPGGLLVVGGTAGNALIQFAQSVADPVNAQLLARSTMRMTRLA
jgi:hypothetical protein